MPEFSIVRFDTVGLALAGGHVMVTRIVDEALIEREGVGIVLVSLRTAFDQILHTIDTALPHHRPSDNAAGVPIYPVTRYALFFYA